MNLDDLTIGDAKKLAGLFSGSVYHSNPYQGYIGKNIMVRTVTMIYTGKLIDVYPEELVLTDATWIAETGRWMEFISNGVTKECEPYPDDHPVIIGRGGILDVTEWTSVLPRSQK